MNNAQSQGGDVSRADLERKLAEIRSVGEKATSVTGEASRHIGLAVGVVAVAVAFLLGRGRGKQGRTIVEVRRG